MKYNPVTRRHFLQGVGSSLMALPILPSLLPRAHAQSIPSPKYLVMVGSPHGGTGYSSDWYPEPVVSNPNFSALNAANLFSSQGGNEIPHQYRWGLLRDMLTRTPAGHLSGNIDQGDPRVSFILGRFFNPYINKMNLYRGIDIGMFYSGHHRGVYGGNIKEAVNNPDARNAMESWPTLDQFLAHSSRFYQPGENISTRVMDITGNISYQADGDSGQRIGNRIDSIYQAIFSRYEDNQSTEVIAERNRNQFLIDRVHQDFRRLTQGRFGPARTISSEDRVRLEQHADFLTDLQRKYQNVVNSCSEVTGPRERIGFNFRQLPNLLDDHRQVYDMTTDLMVAAFQCGASRLGMINAGVTSMAADYHQSVAHAADNDPGAQNTHNLGFRWTAEHILAPLVRKMDSFTLPDGRTILDKGLVVWTHECGPITHQSDSAGLVTFGSLDGFFNTGRYLDYRSLNNLGLLVWSVSQRRPGVPIQRFWANIVRGMGFRPDEFERHGRRGYGDTSINDFPRGSNRNHQGHIAYPTSMINSLSDLLPGLRT
jgi:hypothetical protein